jgi:hypothetical protein
MSFKGWWQIILLCLAIATAVAWSNESKAQIIAAPNIDKVCKVPPLTYRRTVVYVDLGAVRAAKPEWGLTILNRLELAPRESLIVIGINPSTFESKEVFDTCYPVLASSEIEEEQKSRGLWDKLISLDPVAQQHENLQVFDVRLRNGLNKIIDEAGKYQEGSRRNVLGAIALDKNRYSDRSALYRVIIYTDGIIKDLASDGKTQQTLAERYPASFSGAEVAVFGVDGNSQDVSQKEQTFSAYFLKSWGHLRSFSSSLPQQDSFIYPPAMRMDGVFDGGGTQGTLKLALFAAKQGNIAEGWLAFNVGREILYVPFHGEYRCTGEECRLTATCSETVPPQATNPYFRKGDRISLTGKAGHSMQGSLEAAAREVFKDVKDTNQGVKYSLKFAAQ